MNITITLTDTEYKAMEYISTSVEEWINNMLKGRINSATDDIVKVFVEYALSNNISIPSSKDEIILKAYELGVIKTATQRNEEIKAQMTQQTQVQP